MVSKGNARDFRENVFPNENQMYYKMSRISLSTLRERERKKEREREREKKNERERERERDRDSEVIMRFSIKNIFLFDSEILDILKKNVEQNRDSCNN